MTYYPNVFPVTYMEERPSTQSISFKVVTTAHTNKNYDDIFSKMAVFLEEETNLMINKRQEIRQKYPDLLLK